MTVAASAHRLLAHSHPGSATDRPRCQSSSVKQQQRSSEIGRDRSVPGSCRECSSRRRYAPSRADEEPARQTSQLNDILPIRMSSDYNYSFSIHTTTPDTTKLPCLCPVRFGGVNWIPDNSRLSPTENLKSEHVNSNCPIHTTTPDTTQTGLFCRVCCCGVN